MPNTITLKVDQKVTVEHLTQVLIKIGGQLGCHPCGLLGYEVIFKGDPDPNLQKLGGEALKGIQGVKVLGFE